MIDVSFPYILLAVYFEFFFADSTGSGHLFFDYVRIMNYLHTTSQQHGYKFFWFFENTNKMRKVDLNIINQKVGHVKAMSVL